ncbi:MAG: metallophosphoesterase family protein [Chloroflexi bacterium]|nr:metallophosphoesterase family protein [Chloroflexota bacterium]
MAFEQKAITYGIVADTHIPDRVKNLPKTVLSGLMDAHVDVILHAGDACSMQVVHTLEEIAPVKIVQGNRDWLLGLPFPKHISFSTFGVNITLTHSHRSIWHYLLDKWNLLRYGYCFERYWQLLAQDFPFADVIIFGHTHRQVIQCIEGQLFFNPGVAYPCKHNRYHPQFGVLKVTPEGELLTSCY